MPCCAAAMLTNTQPTKSRTRLPLHNMLRRPMLHALHSLPRLRVRLWTLQNVMRLQATKECNDEHHCKDHRDGSNSNGSSNGKWHASARRAAPALPRPSVAPIPQRVQQPQPVALAERQLLQLCTQPHSGRDRVSWGRRRRRQQRPRWMAGEGVGGAALHAGVGAMRRVRDVCGWDGQPAPCVQPPVGRKSYALMLQGDGCVRCCM